ncbi:MULTISPECIES: translesion error-prone DNA polymerase V subunit UmuC [unclassified Brenneria]|uniref:translesion error-prone DNA polymerase V subunit UmuC n=1 Tax=unclassified Brenneria TaxID=2634434 RepID=UPI001557BCBC|nr:MULTISPECIES: translesion error-prone DNA polymerase V subunit UmuC [unclassified Brenneria]MBJ7220919.1 translesion error-prone DNA polymerase V subunit UmuC [Brenneria sp. L3-3C-1]MEE3642160.1 translesion error-prone DNA polymerase V subunit UmuC [Brenneria sp. L3_3C_1]MEE3650467.1 translesion error-prone DNA polymerase V subunit UmuC [Brenneria sp. HEZEL_4_2_4]NPD00423.1 translesion error-prone DNA polymerase V subunit UmuC [Brenneria sp. hezel4-2-4]
MYALVDVNAFYASCETVFRPDLVGKPVVVLSNNDGCVIARSHEVKNLGVKMGAPFFQIGDLIKKYNIAVFSSNYALYADMSARVMSILEEMAPAVEIYSIDEAFLNLSGVGHCMSLEQFGRQVKERIKREAHLTVGVGIAPTKTLAKLANHAAKTWAKTGGIVDLSSPVRQEKLLAITPVGDVWGIGRRLARKLESAGIDTALKLARSDLAYIRRTFSVVMERTVRELRGQSCLEVEELAPAKQQILCSRSFSSRITDYAHMRQAVCRYAERAAEKLRHERQYCCQVSVFIRTSPHVGYEAYYGDQATRMTRVPTDDTRDIISLAVESLDHIWAQGYRYIKAGVVLSDFYRHGVAQLDMFDARKPHVNSESLMSTIDRINHSGKGKIWFAGQGINPGWSMKRERLSPAYTTRIDELRVVKS